MTNQLPTFGRSGCRFFVIAMVGLWVGAACSTAFGQAAATPTSTVSAIPVGGFPIVNVVGGVSINTDGLLSNVTIDAMGMLRKLRMESLQKIPGELNEPTSTRKISLRRLDEAISQCIKDKKPLPDAICYLAGLQHIDYVFVYPEQHDIVLVGGGEGWEIDKQGTAVGITTHRPVMLLDDLLVALRTARAAALGGISCSIDPTPEGLARARQELPSLASSGNPQVLATGLANALGMQKIRVSGVPSTSHFARVLVAADYRMKRLAMAFDPSPVRGLPNYLGMVPSAIHGILSPRFWLEPEFEALLRDPDGLAWQLRGSSVKAMTEEDFLTATGSFTHSGKASPSAKKWAKLMTREYPALAVADSIFGQLQNCMELAVVAALVAKEGLTERAGQSLPTLLQSPNLKTAEFVAPTQVESRGSVVAKYRNWIISASGGVAINSWGLVQKSQSSEALTPLRAKAAPTTGTRWWWN